MLIPLLQSLETFHGELPIEDVLRWNLLKTYSLTANSYMIFTDSTSSYATYPIWTCTVDCGSPLSGVGLMVQTLKYNFATPVKAYISQVFPATSTTGAYEVQNPPSGYPALEVSSLTVVTDTAFSTVTLIDVA